MCRTCGGPGGRWAAGHILYLMTASLWFIASHNGRVWVCVCVAKFGLLVYIMVFWYIITCIYSYNTAILILPYAIIYHISIIHLAKLYTYINILTIVPYIDSLHHGITITCPNRKIRRAGGNRGGSSIEINRKRRVLTSKCRKRVYTQSQKNVESARLVAWPPRPLPLDTLRRASFRACQQAEIRYRGTIVRKYSRTTPGYQPTNQPKFRELRSLANSIRRHATRQNVGGAAT